MALDEALNGAVRLTFAHYGVTQAQGAALLGLNRSQLQRRLSGTTQWMLDDLDRIVTRFGIPPEKLFAGGLVWIEHLIATQAHPFRGGRMQTAIA